MPDGWPLPRRAIGDQGGIDSVTEHDLDASDVLVERAAEPDVPVIEPEPGIEIMAGRGTSEPSRSCVSRLAIVTWLVIDRAAADGRLNSELPGTVPAWANGRGYALFGRRACVRVGVLVSAVPPGPPAAARSCLCCRRLCMAWGACLLRIRCRLRSAQWSFRPAVVPQGRLSFRPAGFRSGRRSVRPGVVLSGRLSFRAAVSPAGCRSVRPAFVPGGGQSGQGSFCPAGCRSVQQAATACASRSPSVGGVRRPSVLSREFGVDMWRECRGCRRRFCAR